jgi:hypothetical protein
VSGLKQTSRVLYMAHPLDVEDKVVVITLNATSTARQLTPAVAEDTADKRHHMFLYCAVDYNTYS